MTSKNATKSLISKNTTKSVSRQKQNATRIKRPLDASTTPVAHQLERIASFRMRDSILRYGPRCKFVLVGDSIIFYLKRNTTLWQDYVNRYAGINLGNPGDRTEHVLHRIQSKLFRNLTSPLLLAVMVGTNNVGAGDSAGATLDGIVNVVSLLGKEIPKARLVVFSILPRGGGVEMMKTITDVNARLREKYSGGAASTTQFLDMTASFSNANGSMNTKLFERDQLHPNNKGSLVLLQALEPYLSKIAPYPPPYEAPRVPSRSIPAKGRNATKIVAPPASTSKKIVAKKVPPHPAPATATATAPAPATAPPTALKSSSGWFSSFFGWLGGGRGGR
jgi:lysophospholipase L1-like esterase